MDQCPDVTAFGLVVMTAKNISLETGWFSGLPSGGWNQIAPQVSLFREEADKKLSSFKQKHLQTRTNFFNMSIPSQAGSALQNLQAFGSRLLHHHKGISCIIIFVCTYVEINVLFSSLIITTRSSGAIMQD